MHGGVTCLGLRVDVWGRQATIALDDPSTNRLLAPVLEAILAHPDIDTVWENTRPNTTTSGTACGRPLPRRNAQDDNITVLEDGLRFEVKPWMGLDAGLYPDMRDIRAWLRPYWAGKRVLNTFAYTGAFSVAAAANGAARGRHSGPCGHGDSTHPEKL